MPAGASGCAVIQDLTASYDSTGHFRAGCRLYIQVDRLPVAEHTTTQPNLDTSSSTREDDSVRLAGSFPTMWPFPIDEVKASLPVRVAKGIVYCDSAGPPALNQVVPNDGRNAAVAAREQVHQLRLRFVCACIGDSLDSAP